MDYYNLLGIEKNATEDEIKKAFRKLAKQYHPDVNPNNSSAEQKFKEINEAYSVLSDPEQKSNYDRFGTASPQYNPFEGGFNPFGGFDPSSIFEDFFGGRHRGHRGNSDLQAHVRISPKDLLLGVTKNLIISKTIACSNCNGEGGQNPKMCSGCMGRGAKVQMTQNGPFMMQQTVHCNDCNGKGKIFASACNICRTAGKISQQETIKLNIPANCPVFATLLVSAHGNQEDNKYPPGNLHVSLDIERTNNVQEISRDGNVHIVAEISLSQWYNNESIQINRFDVENILYDLTNLNCSDKQYRFSEKGLRNANNTAQGDLIVSFKINK
jgi:molecular chaperone DnaJ